VVVAVGVVDVGLVLVVGVSGGGGRNGDGGRTWKLRFLPMPIQKHRSTESKSIHPERARHDVLIRCVDEM
jgi:hypothetical protein